MQLLPVVVFALNCLSVLASGHIGSAWLDGYGPLDKDVGLPDVFHHLGSYSARWTDPHLLTSYIRRHARDFASDATTQQQLYPPPGCKVTLVNSLQRHGARYPSQKALKKQAKINQRLAHALQGIPNEQLNDPTLGQVLRDLPITHEYGDLVPYGALQAYYSGLFDREVYGHLANQKPFVRASGNYGNQATGPSDRVLYTARWWKQAFENRGFPQQSINTSDQVRHIVDLPEIDVVVSELKGINNTLDPSTCPNYKSFPSKQAQHTYGDNTLRDVVGARLEHRLHPANITFSTKEVESIFSQCSFLTLSSANITNGQLDLKVHPLCNVFEPNEWLILDYYYSLKFYCKSAGNPYYRAASQGYLRELYARLNDSALPLTPVTTINTTTVQQGGFPLPNQGQIQFYLDASHDGNLAPTAQAFGLFSGSGLPDFKHAEQQYNGPFSASKIVPFQTKYAWEKISCEGHDTPYVRVRINEAVHPVTDSWCPVQEGDEGNQHTSTGLCPLPAVLRNLEWANGVGEWPKCFENTSASSSA